ncbi:MAG: acyl-phosphate glycerol 3-phosphate acyltransferase [Verrucomicrobiales bacterium]|nr:acyl-phosphate glycerol 3-phosphate acyltransferase [Verrucomicrobiales bacterium]|tara:strand:- start:17668 stop:18300 length:633 start_codon:yes stop_codon:yes gene_type:complete
MSLAYLIAAIAAYFIGSLPTGFLVAKAKGVDIRKVGSGNIGATNVFRAVGKGPGTFVLLVDALKGCAPVLWIAPLCQHADSEASLDTLRIVSGIAAIMGHNYTCWLRFKGGKGIATSAGAFGALTPQPLGIAALAWVIVFSATKYVSLASIVAAAALPIATWIMPFGMPLRIITTIIGVLAIVKHRANIQRLLAGKELRIGEKKTAEAAE